MKKLFILLFAITSIIVACDDKADPFRNKSEFIKDAEVKPTEEPPIPGIDEGAMSITLQRDLDTLFFEEGVEYSYEVNVRLYLPDIDFEAVLVGAPQGMTLELQSEQDVAGPTTAPAPTPAAPTTTPTTPADDKQNSVANQKIYVIKWKPGMDAIPDPSIPTITRFLNFQVNIGKDKQRTREFRYSVSQATRKLKINSVKVSPDLREGEKRGTVTVYVNYPGLQGTNLPQIFFENVLIAGRTECATLPQAFVNLRTKYITAPNDPNFESIEYLFDVDLTRFNILSGSVSILCELNAYVTNIGNLSDPFPVSMTVLNSLTDPVTNWAEGQELEFEQEKDVAFYFQVYGGLNEGTISMNFTKPCTQVFRDGNQSFGDCKCKSSTAFNSRHRIECLIEANHKKTFSAQTYTLEFEAQMTNGPSLNSRKVKFSRRIKFGSSGWGLFSLDSDPVDSTSNVVVPPIKPTAQ